jgi:hypothetical protein
VYGRGQRGDRIINQQRHEPAPGSVPRHGDGAGFGASWQWTRPDDRQWPVKLSQAELPVTIAKGTARVLCRGPRALLGLEFRIASALIPKRGKPSLQVPKRLLERHRRHVVQECQLVGALPSGEQRRGSYVADLPLAGVPGGCPCFEGLVIDQAYAPERAGQLGGLLVCGVPAVLIRPLHASGHAHIVVSGCDNPEGRERRILPPPRRWGPSRRAIDDHN